MEATLGSPVTSAGIDGEVTGPVLVLGAARLSDRLDLLARPCEHDAIVEWLVKARFQRWRRSWTRHDDGLVNEVRLRTTGSRLGGSHHLDVLFDGAEAMPGHSHLMFPGPAAEILLAARDLVGRRGTITSDERRRVRQALSRDPEAWRVAGMRAPAAGLAGALRLLRRAYAAPMPLPPAARAAGLVGMGLGGGPIRARAAVAARALPRPRRIAVVSFSGLDGSGKSTQASRLQDSLARLGHPTDRQWAGFKTGSSLRAALPVLDRSVHHSSRDPLVPATCLGHPLGQHVWTFAVVAVNAVSLWRYVLLPRAGAEVVIFDRFSPDAAVKLDLHYGCNRQFDVRRQRAVFAALSPKPDVGFLVAVPADVAYSRRQEQSPEELATMAGLYEDLAPRFGLVRLDGTQSVDELSQRVFAAAWRGMR